MRVFVTGHRGYIGTHLVRLLKERGHFVTGCDLRLFNGCEWEDFLDADVEVIEDIRVLTEEHLKGHDCLIHLAALSNDPMGDIDPMMTYSINRDGSVHLAKVAKKVGISRFLFAGSCSIYGQGERLDLNEDSEYRPLTPYACSKVEAEYAIRALADDSFSPTFLRNATAYGDSPMLRIDLVVNNLLACALSKGDIRIMSDGTPWRPLIHCKDIARAFMALAESPREDVHNLAVNVGGNGENYQVKDVAHYVQKLIPEAQILYTGECPNDPRNYKVNFDLLATILPSFELEYSLEQGMTELYEKMKNYRFGNDDFEGEQFVRLRTLSKQFKQQLERV